MTIILPTPSTPLRIGTRGSPLALAQAYETRDRLAAAFDLPTDALETLRIAAKSGSAPVCSAFEEISKCPHYAWQINSVSIVVIFSVTKQLRNKYSCIEIVNEYWQTVKINDVSLGIRDSSTHPRSDLVLEKHNGFRIARVELLVQIGMASKGT